MSVSDLTLFYDGNCPFCKREVDWLRKRDRDGKLDYVDICDPGFDQGQHRLQGRDVHARIHAVRADGEVLEGMAVFREVYRRLGLGWLLAPTGWPVLRPTFDLLYRLFARNRLRLGRLLSRGNCGESRCDRHGDDCRTS